MYNFFVLGQIPGTNITITFTMWMELCAAVTAIAILYTLVRSRTATGSEQQAHTLTETQQAFTEIAI